MRLAFCVVCVLIERYQYLICVRNYESKAFSKLGLSNVCFVIGRQEGAALRSSSLIGVLRIVL
jgi:hypothetical protein